MTPILIPLKPTSIILKNKKIINIINIKTHPYILKKNMKNIYMAKKKTSSLPDEPDSDFFFLNEK